MKQATALLSLAFAVLLAPGANSQEVVYDNSVNDLSIRFNTGTARVGDEVNLGGAARELYGFEFEFYYTNATLSAGAPSFQVTLYANDGALYNSEPTPGTVLWSSPTYNGLITAFTPRSTFAFDTSDFGTGIILPETLTWTVQFGNLQSGDEIGLDIYSAPVTGSSAPDYWIDSGSGWQLMVHPTDPLNNPFDFAATITAVPEPSSFALALLGGAVFMAWRRRR